MADERKFWHETGILEWFNQDFPIFTSKEGQEVLEKNADEIIRELDNYFTPDYMKISQNAQYLKRDIEDIKKTYENRDYKAMGEALEKFKLAVEWL